MRAVLIFLVQMSLQSLFINALDAKLRAQRFLKSTMLQFGDTEVTTYYSRDSGAIVDILDNECSLTTRRKNIVFVFYEEDYLQVAEDVLGELGQ